MNFLNQIRKPKLSEIELIDIDLPMNLQVLIPKEICLGFCLLAYFL